MASGTLFDSAIGAFGGGVATASIGGGGGGSARQGAAMAMAPGASMASAGGGGQSPFAPTHPAGVALWVGVISVALLALLWYSLPE